MIMSIVTTALVICSYINLLQAFTIASYNTDHTTPGKTNPLTETQISQIATSGFDIICLQELTDITTAGIFHQSLTEAYPYSFSELNVYDLSARAPCTAEQASLLSSGSCMNDNCADTRFDPNAFAECGATKCQEDFFQLVYTECFYCAGFCPILPTELGCPFVTLESSAQFCTNVLPIPIDLLSGNAIFSKLPIVNQWIMDYPSWLLQRSFVLTEIDVCSVTQNTNANVRMLLSSSSSNSDDDDDDNDNVCTDTIIVGCVHLKDNDMIDPISTYYPATQEQVDQDIKSHVELNAYQSNYIFENILNPKKAPWMNDADYNNVLQIFMAGDFNVGELLNIENLQIWYDEGFVNAKRIHGIENVEEGGTYNPNEDSELPNILARQGSIANNWVLFDRDLDQILVYNGDEYDIGNDGQSDDDSDNSVAGLNANSFSREFTEIYDVDTEQLPMSDHWGVSLDFDFE